eukprot:COSAG06_NODE_48460_length_332_cov_0.635193_1_plen_31_part_10
MYKLIPLSRTIGDAFEGGYVLMSAGGHHLYP